MAASPRCRRRGGRGIDPHHRRLGARWGVVRRRHQNHGLYACGDASQRPASVGIEGGHQPAPPARRRCRQPVRSRGGGMKELSRATTDPLQASAKRSTLPPLAKRCTGLPTAQLTRGFRFGLWSSSPQDSWARFHIVSGQLALQLKSDGQKRLDRENERPKI